MENESLKKEFAADVDCESGGNIKKRLSTSEPVQSFAAPGSPLNSALNRNLLLAICASSIGSAFQYGYNVSVLNNLEKVVNNWIGIVTLKNSNETASVTDIEFLYSLITAGFCVGGLFGGLSVGFFADRFGRKGSLLLNNIFVLLSVLFVVFAKSFDSFWLFFFARILIGFNAGLGSGIVPMYLSEITPVKLRGAVGSVYQLVVTVSILFGMALGMNMFLGTDNLWVYAVAFTSIPAIFQLFTLPACPESPKYLLINKKKESKAQKALLWLRAGADINDELLGIKAEEEELKNTTALTFQELLTKYSLRTPLIIVLVIMLAQQFSGINAVMSFSNGIFEKAGLGKLQCEIATLVIGCINVFMTFVSMVIVDRAGRKTLLQFGFIGMAIVMLLLTVLSPYSESYDSIKWLCVFLVVAFVIIFASGPGSIPWFLVSEMFNQSARPKATSLAVGVNWFAYFLVTLLFKKLETALGSYVFLIFFVLLVIFSIFIYFKVPETKGKTIEEVSAMFRQENYK